MESKALVNAIVLLAVRAEASGGGASPPRTDSSSRPRRARKGEETRGVCLRASLGCGPAIEGRLPELDGARGLPTVRGPSALMPMVRLTRLTHKRRDLPVNDAEINVLIERRHESQKKR